MLECSTVIHLTSERHCTFSWAFVDEMERLSAIVSNIAPKNMSDSVRAWGFVDFGHWKYWGWVTHIYVSNSTIGRHRAIIWTNAGILLIRTLGINLGAQVSPSLRDCGVLCNTMTWPSLRCLARNMVLRTERPWTKCQSFVILCSGRISNLRTFLCYLEVCPE